MGSKSKLGFMNSNKITKKGIGTKKSKKGKRSRYNK